MISKAWHGFGVCDLLGWEMLGSELVPCIGSGVSMNCGRTSISTVLGFCRSCSAYGMKRIRLI